MVELQIELMTRGVALDVNRSQPDERSDNNSDSETSDDADEDVDDNEDVVQDEEDDQDENENEDNNGPEDDGSVPGRDSDIGVIPDAGSNIIPSQTMVLPGRRYPPPSRRTSRKTISWK